MPRLVSFLEIIPLQHAGNGVTAGQADQVAAIEFVQPFRVEDDFCLFTIEDFENLLFIGLDVFLNVVRGACRPRLIPAAGVADSRRIVSDQKVNLVPQVLEGLQLSKKDGMAEMKIGGGGIEARLDLERLTFGELFF